MFAKVACVVLVCMVVAGLAPHAEAITCGQIQGQLASCIPYLTGRPLLPRCCAGVRAVASSARTTAARQTACRCLQAAARSFRGINLGNAAALPGRCGVRIPYRISPYTDCSRVR